MGEIWPRYGRWLRHAQGVIVLLAIFAYIGIPGAVVLCDMLVLIGAFAIAIYLVFRSRLGSQAAKVAVPSALVLAFVTLATALSMFGGAGDSLATSAAGSFAAAGAICSRWRWRRARASRFSLSNRSAAEPHTTLLARGAGFALEAIEASHQGIFDLDFAGDMLSLSHDAAALVGLPDANSTLRHADWLARYMTRTVKSTARRCSTIEIVPGFVSCRVPRAQGRQRFLGSNCAPTMLGDGERARAVWDCSPTSVRAS